MGRMTNPKITRRAALTGLTATSALGLAPAALAAPPSAQSLLDRLAWGLLQRFPTGATSLGVDKGAHAALRGRLDDRSGAGVAELGQFLKASLGALKRQPRGGLDSSAQTSLAVVESAFATALEGMALPYGSISVGGWRNAPYGVIQNVGGWIDVPQTLDGEQPVKNARDAEYYLARLAATPALLDGETQRIREARGLGLIPPDFLLDKTLDAMGSSITASARADGPLIAPLLRKTQGIAGDWQARAQSIVRAVILPALHRQRAEIAAQRALATSDAGMLKRPHGEAWYAWGLRAGTTTRRSPHEIHEIGREQLARLMAEMDVILKSLGLTQGSVAERAAALQERPAIAFGTDDAARAQITAFMRAKIDAIRPRLPQAFRRLARGNLEIRRLPLAEEPGAPSAYGGPGSIDGTVPGKIWVNLGDPSVHNRVTIPDLVYHEGIPGHVWQGEYAQALPLIRSILAFNAYTEGWALYAEQLADELGMYDGDPAGRLGYLMGLSWRAARLVVDTGLHAFGWSRDKALDEFIAATGLTRPNAASEVDRYCAWPGQACGYMLGQIEINAQRDRARSVLGGRYDLRDFNQAVVDGGNVPLDVLGQNVSRYIAGAKA
jgi:uncharacterized protein (DUF885 family)